MPEEGERLQKVLAHAGWASRRKCEELIAAGRVAVDGVVAELGRRVDPAVARVTVDGVPVIVDPQRVTYVLNKPAGVVSTASDPRGRRTVVDLVPADPRVFPVGRLDLATEGLLILTNDGDLAQALTHPSRGVDKEYLVEVEGTPGPSALRALRDGVELDGEMTAPAEVRILQRHGASAALRVVIHEGRNRQVRRMCEAVGHPVTRLVRTRIGPFTDRSLAPGEWRVLSAPEVASLYGAALMPTSREGGHGKGRG